MKAVLLAIAIFTSGCGAAISDNNPSPTIFLVDHGNDNFHLEWTQPLTAPQIVVFAMTGFSYVPQHSLDLWVKHGMPIADAPEYLGKEGQTFYRHFVFFEGNSQSFPVHFRSQGHDAVIVEILRAEQASEIFNAAQARSDFWRTQMFIPPPPTYTVGTPHILTNARGAR